mmetsp:Transcript_2331/g.7493  ORF Transcript_2331/g.7493 Transcript_2331/m.7493 type:complete len:190 (-) Transcript_2331:1190-1759(-)
MGRRTRHSHFLPSHEQFGAICHAPHGAAFPARRAHIGDATPPPALVSASSTWRCERRRAGCARQPVPGFGWTHRNVQPRHVAAWVHYTRGNGQSAERQAGSWLAARRPRLMCAALTRATLTRLLPAPRWSTASIRARLGLGHQRDLVRGHAHIVRKRPVDGSQRLVYQPVAQRQSALQRGRSAEAALMH